MWPLPRRAILTLFSILLSATPCLGQAQGNPFGGAAAGGDPIGGAQAGGNPFGGTAGGGAPPAGLAPAAPGGGVPPSPFGGAAGGADPFAGGSPAPPAPGPTSTTPSGSKETNSIVLAIRETNPTTPKQLMFAVHALFEIGRTDEAKLYLKQLMQTQSDRDQLESFHREYGSHFFYRLWRDHRTKPEGEQFGRAVMDAAYEASQDPERLREAVTRLSDPSFTVRRRAIDELRRAEDAVVPVLLEALADPQREQEHPGIRQVIPQLGPTLLAPMLGALQAPDEQLRGQVMRVLGEFRTPRAVPLLVASAVDTSAADVIRQSAQEAMQAIVGRVPTRREAEHYLVDRIRDFYKGALPGNVDYEDQITVWRWDEASGTVMPYRYPAPLASRLMAARLSRDLLQLDPEDPEIRRLLLTTLLDFGKTDAGLDHPLPQDDGSVFGLAAAAGVEAIEDVLDHAMREGYAVAAMGAADVLGEIGDVTLLDSECGRPRPLVAALRHNDRRLRLAAADAIMNLNPQRTFAGSSYLPETLGYLVRTVGSRRALVAHPRIIKSQTLVGMLNRIGYEADSAATGNDAFSLASRNPDYEFILISDALSKPTVLETVAMFRRDPRTAQLPLGLMAREAKLQYMSDVAAQESLTLAFPRPHDEATMAFQANQLLDLAGRQRVPFDERLAEGDRALDHLVTLAASPKVYAFYDLYRQQESLKSALFAAPLSAKAAKVLGLLGSPEAQQALVTLASQHAVPLEHRQAAAQAFDTAVRGHGLLLTRDEVLQQYDRYNQSETLDAGTQQVMGSLLDAIEWPSKQQAQERPASDATSSLN